MLESHCNIASFIANGTAPVRELLHSSRMVKMYFLVKISLMIQLWAFAFIVWFFRFFFIYLHPLVD